MSGLLWTGGYAAGMLIASAVAGWHWNRFVREPHEEPVPHIFGVLFWPVPFVYFATAPIAALVTWPFMKAFTLATGKNANVSREMIGEFQKVLGFEPKPAIEGDRIKITPEIVSKAVAVQRAEEDDEPDDYLNDLILDVPPDEVPAPKQTALFGRPDVMRSVQRDEE